MWNSKAPLKLLLSMPSQLTKENLINLQKVIDVDKIVNSQKLKRDLCGEYAPFCDFCDKKLMYPCANAYVKMKQSEGLDVEIPESVIEEVKLADSDEHQEQPTEADTDAVEEVIAEEVKEEKPKHYIRIAVAKKTR